jgi:hypothetical protein
MTERKQENQQDKRQQQQQQQQDQSRMKPDSDRKAGGDMNKSQGGKPEHRPSHEAERRDRN